MAYIIGCILVIIASIIVALIMRKRIYDQVDRNEEWKLDILNRDIASQLSRIKRLNLSGETQEKFETWKERWEQIVSKELSDIDGLLFDAEEAADRYRFPTAKKLLKSIEKTLQSIEEDIQNMLDELEELLESEETSRKEMEELQPHIKNARKKLAQNRYQYGKAEVRFEVAIDDLEEKLATYNELVASGNYMEARQVVEELKEDVAELDKQLDRFPELYKACKHELPTQLDDLYHGLREMKEGGYHIEHLGFEKEIHDYQRRLLDAVNALDKADMATAQSVIAETEERIEEMYQILEQEAIAKGFVETKLPNYRSMLEELDNDFQETKAEVDVLKNSYYLEDEDMEEYITLEKAIDQLKTQLRELLENIDVTPHSESREILENGFQQLEELQKRHETFKKGIDMLRKDELEAKESIQDMKKQIRRLHRRLNKSNIPGVPMFIWNMMEDAVEKNDRVLALLEKQPLDINEVQQALAEAQTAVANISEQTETILEQAYLTERVIQYANRYRSQNATLANKLAESERLFRSFEYELALEKAAHALEEVEPGALKRIEAHVEETG